MAYSTIFKKSLLVKPFTGAGGGASASGWQDKPTFWYDIRTSCPENSIALYAAHKEDYSSYDNLGFTATCIGGYKVFIDGTQFGTTYASGATCSITWSESGITTGDSITTPIALKAHTIWITPATEGAEITAFHCSRVASSGTEEQGLLWAHFNITNAIGLDTLFFDDNYKNTLVTAVTAKNNKINITSQWSWAGGLYIAFCDCALLEYLPVLNTMDTETHLNYWKTFKNCEKLTTVTLTKGTSNKYSYEMFSNSGIKKIKGNFTMEVAGEAFANCQYLEELPRIDAANSTSGQMFLTNAVSLKNTILDLREATNMTMIQCYGDASHFMTGFKGLRVSNEAPFNDISVPQISVAYTGMDKAALAQLFNDLPTVSDGQIINVTGCVGSEDLTAQEVQIAINKGWTVTGGPEPVTYRAYTNTNDDSVFSTDNPVIDVHYVLQNSSKEGDVFVDKKGVISNISSTSYVQISPYTSYTSSFEFVSKVKLSTSGSSAIIGNGDDNYSGGGFVLRTNNGTRLYLWGIYNYSSWDIGQFDTFIDLPTDGSWLWVKMTWDGSYYRFWKSNDGVDYGTAVNSFYSTTPLCTPLVSKIGASGNTNFYFKGEIDLSETYIISDGNKVTYGYFEQPSVIYENTGTDEDFIPSALVPQPEFEFHNGKITNCQSVGMKYLGEGKYSASSSSYIITNDSYDLTNAESWEIETEYQYKSIPYGDPVIWASGPSDFCGALLYCVSGRILLFLRTTAGGDWSYNGVDMNISLTNEGVYPIKFGYNPTDKFYCKTKVNGNWTMVWNNTDGGTQIQGTIISNSKFNFANWQRNLSYYYSAGYIDLSKTKVTVDNTTVNLYDSREIIEISNVDYIRNESEDKTLWE